MDETRTDRLRICATQEQVEQQIGTPPAPGGDVLGEHATVSGENVAKSRYIKKACMPLKERTELAARARHRRIDLGLTQSECATQIGVSSAVFAHQERCLLKFPDREVETKWEVSLGVAAGWLRDKTLETPDVVFDSGGALDSDTIPVVPEVTWNTLSGEIRAVGAWLSRQEVVRRTTDIGELNENERRKAEAFARRYGVYGDENSSLESTGQALGLTRERIRQVVLVMVERAHQLPMPTPYLDALIEEIQKRAPESIVSIEGVVRPILGERLSLLNAQRFANELFGRKLGQLFNSPWNKRSAPDLISPIGTLPDDGLMKAIRSTSRKMIRGSGAANIHFVCGAASDEFKGAIDVSLVRSTVTGIDGFQWLSKEDGWFWFGADGGENRLHSVMKKIMSVIDRRVDIDTIYAAMGRSQRGAYKDSNPYVIEAPAAILAKVLQRTPWLTCVQHNDFVIKDNSVLKGALSDVEIEIIKCIREHNGVTIKYTIDQHTMKALSVSQMSVTIALSRSPCFVQPAHGLYAICGGPLLPGALAKALSASDALHNRNADMEPDEAGFYRFTITLSEYQLKHRFIGVPACLESKIESGSYLVVEQSDPVIIVKRNSGLTAILKILRCINAIQAQVGDVIEVRINPQDKLVGFNLVSSETIADDQLL